MYFRQSDTGNKLPYFITKNYTNGTIGGYSTDADVGNYNMECVGVDDAYWETVISFMLVVKRNLILISLLIACYFKCQTCWDSDYNTCKGCKPSYFLYNAECLDLCVIGTYPEIATWQCL